MPTFSNNLLENIFTIIKDVVSFNSASPVIEKILSYALSFASADGFLFFKITPEKRMFLESFHITSIQDKLSETEKHQLYQSKSLSDIKKQSLKTPPELCAVNQEIFNSANIYTENHINNSTFAKIDKLYNYSTTSVFSVPLVNRKRMVLGVVTFINAQDINGKNIIFSPSTQNILTSLCDLITLVLENSILRGAQSQFLESFIEVIIRAINAKSPSTSNHCQKVPIITKLLTSAAIEEQNGSLKNFDMSKQDWRALHIASYLHDCGKITTPEHIVEKATKLENINNRIHEIRNRFEILRRDAHILYLQKRLNNTDSKENLQAEFINEVKSLEDDFAFVAQCNIGDNIITPADKERLDKISSRTFTRYFNRMLGLSWAEKNDITSPELYNHPAQEKLLQDTPDHLKDGYNYGELYNLKIEKGTINNEERQKINEHINVTIDMLKALPSSPEIEQIIEYAGCHHEWVNGKGYPNQLTGEQMSIPAKIMAIADVFEALTSRDRAYKSPKKLSEVLRIMQEMKNIGHLDAELYQIFIRHKVYLDYAKQYIEPEQIDDIYPEEYL